MSFSDDALAMLLQTCPQITDKIVSFQDLSEEVGQENPTKVGVFILLAGSSNIFIPVLARQDTVMPLDSVFFSDKKQFFPLNDRIVQWIVNSTHPLGKPKKIPSGVVGNPSVEALVNPPRTGKFVYAGDRFTEFLAALDEKIKKDLKATLLKDENLKALHKVLDLKKVVRSLDAPTQVGRLTRQELLPGSLQVTRFFDPNSENIPPHLVNQVITKGWAAEPSDQVRLVVEEATNHYYNELSFVDTNKAYRVVKNDGQAIIGFSPDRRQMSELEENYSPQYKKPNVHGEPTRDVRQSFLIFENGNYAMSRAGQKFVIEGAPQAIGDVFDQILANVEKVPLVDLAPGNNGATFALFDVEGRLYDVFSLLYRTGSQSIVELRVLSMLAGLGTCRLVMRPNANIEQVGWLKSDNTIIVPVNAVAVLLNQDITDHICTNAIHAEALRRFQFDEVLEQKMLVGYDGFEYQIDGTPIPRRTDLMRRLIVDEGFAPDVAEHFAKRAEETGRVRLSMSKKADVSFHAGVIPSFGIDPPPQDKSRLDTRKTAYGKVKLDEGGREIPPLSLMDPTWMRTVQIAASTGDKDIVEATIMGNLMTAVPIDLLREYLPDLATTIDKIGRLLFVFRLKMTEMIKDKNPLDVEELLQRMRTVYRALGVSYLDLVYLMATLPEPDGT